MVLVECALLVSCCGALWGGTSVVSIQPPGVLGLEPLRRGSGAGPGQMLFMPVLEPLGRSYRVICGWLPLALGLEELRRCYVVNQGWLLLVPGLGPFGGHNDAS